MSTVEQRTSVPTGTWTADPVHSGIGFAVKHNTVMTFKGEFGDFDASLVDGRLEGSARVASVEVDDPNLVGHLQAPDFFDAERHPELGFVSESIEIAGERITIAGELTIRGTTARSSSRARSPAQSPTATATSGSVSTSRPRSTATTSGSAGTPTSPVAIRCSPTTSSSPPTSR